MASLDAQDSPLSSEHCLNPSDLSLDQLVDIFLASKRSLSCIPLVQRAQEIVETGRDAVEENAVVAAKNSFVRYAVDMQMESLEGIRCGGDAVRREGRDELQETIKALDEASARLNATLDALRSTMVDPAFRDAEEQTKHLFEFVDEAGVNDLYDSIKKSMDRVDTSQRSFSETCASFEDILTHAYDTLEADHEELSKSHGYLSEDGASPIPSFFYGLETHATEVASHLQGLVKHYDLCVAALQNTEGGGEAMSKASQDESAPQESKLAGFGLGIDRIEEPPLTEQTAEDRAAMLVVIIKDANEVDDVVDEIRERLAEMEEQLARIQSYIDMLRSTSDCLRRTHIMLRQALDQIPDYLSACSIFQHSWEEEKDILITRVDEIEGLTEFYVGFAAGYDNLIIEVQRRRKTRREMEKVMNNALNQVEKLYKQELERREEFKIEQGEFLPIDIWPGLMNPPARYEVSAVGDEAHNLPDLKKSIVEKALKRIETRSIKQ